MSRKVAELKKSLMIFLKTLRAYHFAHIASLREINLRNMSQ